MMMMMMKTADRIRSRFRTLRRLAKFSTNHSL